MRSAYAQQKDYFDFGVRERLRAFLDPIFTAGVVVAVQVLLSAPNNENPNLFSIGEGFGFFVFFGNDNSGSFPMAVCPKPYQKKDRITKVTTVKVP